MQKPTNSVRNRYLDIVKGLLIISVVVGHCVQHGSGRAFCSGNYFYDNWLFKFIYSFHMPLFMLVCGYFFANSIERRSLKETLSKRLKSLLVPILIWSVIPISIFISKVIRHGIPEEITFIDTAQKILKIITDNLWFLWAVLYNSLIVLFIHKVLKDSIWAYAVIFILLFFVPNAMYLHCFMYPYFVLGYLYNKRFAKSDKIQSIQQKSSLLLTITGIAFFAMLPFFEREHYIYTSLYNILNGNPLHQTGVDLFRFFIGLFGSIFVMLSIKRLHDLIGDRRGVLAYLGRNTIGIYIVSSYLNPLLLDICRKLDGPNYLYIAIESVIVIILSLSIVTFIKRNHTASRLLLGS